MIYSASLAIRDDDVISGYSAITNKIELDRLVADNTNANIVYIRRDFIDKYFTVKGVIEYKEQAAKINKKLTIKLPENVTYEYADDILKLVGDARSMNDLINIAAFRKKDYFDCVRKLARNANSASGELLQASASIARMYAELDAQKTTIDDLKYELEVERKNKALYEAELDSLIKRINYQFGRNVDKKTLFTARENQFDKIIYIKELTRVQYVDSFIYYLKQILSTRPEYNLPARLLVMEPFYALGKIPQYKHVTPQHRLRYRDVKTGDILMLGNQPELMKNILSNASKVSLLIVLDRTGFDKPHIVGRNIEYFYTASAREDFPDRVDKTRIISYSEDTLYIPMIRGFEKLDPSTKMSKYSEMDIMHAMVQFIEG